MKRFPLPGVALALALLIGLACASPATHAPAAATSSQPQAASAASAPADTSPQWQEALARARQEGRVVVDVSPEVVDAFRAAFQVVPERFGFAVETRAAGTGEIAQLILRECSVGRQSLDVVLGGLSEAFEAYPRGCLAPIKSQLLLPE